MVEREHEGNVDILSLLFRSQAELMSFIELNMINSDQFHRGLLGRRVVSISLSYQVTSKDHFNILKSTFITSSNQDKLYYEVATDQLDEICLKLVLKGELAYQQAFGKEMYQKFKDATDFEIHDDYIPIVDSRLHCMFEELYQSIKFYNEYS